MSTKDFPNDTPVTAIRMPQLRELYSKIVEELLFLGLLLLYKDGIVYM